MAEAAQTSLDLYNEQKAKVADSKNAEARTCANADCTFRPHLRSGGEPCNLCRHMTLGDFYVAAG